MARAPVRLPSAPAATPSPAPVTRSADPTEALERRLIGIARAIALDVEDVSDVLARHGVTATEWPTLSTSPFFANALADFRVQYGSSEGQEERIRAKARIAVEELIEDAFDIVRNGAGEDGNARVQALKVLAAIGGMGQKQVEDGRPKVAINIDFGSNLRVAASGAATAPLTIDHE